MSESRTWNWIRPVIEAECAVRRRRATVSSGLVAILWGLWIWREARQSGEPLPASGFGWLAGAFVLILAARLWARRRAPDVRAIARRVEMLDPELDGRLLTALEPAPDRKDRVAAFLRHRLEGEVQAHWRRHPWHESYRRRERFWYGLGQAAVGLVMLVVTVLLVSVNAPYSGEPGSTVSSAAGEALQVAVSPGNTEVEQGARLVVEARFAAGAPQDVALEWLDAAGTRVESRLEMRRSLDDPVYGAVVPRVDRGGRYRVVYAGGVESEPGHSDTYTVSVYVHPELQRADVTVRPPDYAGEKERVLQDVRSVRALEGSELGFRLQVNKPVAEAELFGEDGTIVALKPDGHNGVVLRAGMRPAKSQRYRVHLVDAEGRANKEPPWIQVQLLENQRPKLELAFPGKDVEVSALQEMAVAGKVWDDLGVERLGAVVTVGETAREIVLRDQALPGRQKHDWEALFALEELAAQPAQLVSYYVWAEDKGPSGELRRTESDLFLAEVRHWEHSFREAPPSGGQPGQDNQSQQLRVQQKDIINATWNLTRRIERAGAVTSKEDVKAVRRSQEIVMENVARVMEEMPDAGLTELLSQARSRMEAAAGFLSWVEDQADAGPLADALRSERAAYQFLLEAEGRETQVTRSKSSRPGAAGGQAQPRRLLDLELKQVEDRYETERQAQSEAQAGSEQQENLEILRRLKELARRQEAVAERLRELEARLEEARTPGEEKDLARQLQRLREEQEELLRDVDQLLERMDGRENQDRLQQERGRLEGAREQVRQAGESLRNERLAEAANAASRARQTLKELQEEFRERSASHFAEEMRQMRVTARELAQKQEEIGERLEQAPDSRNPFQNEEAIPARREMLGQLGEQREHLDGLLKNMRQVSEQAEVSEPVLSSALYEAVRRARTEGVEESLDEALTLVRFGALDRAVESERMAGRAMVRLKEDVEKAAEAVLGSEAESLRQARAELDRLIGALEEEARGRRAGDRRPETADARRETGDGRPEMGEAKKESGAGSSEPGEGKVEVSSLPPPASRLNLFFHQPETEPDRGPLTGDGYTAWAAGMRRLEDLLENPALCSAASRILDRAREYRTDYRRHDLPPRWDLVQTNLVRPLVELRDRVAEELARLEKRDALVPVDRDPVPVPYRELVRKYYEKLARGE